MINNGTAPSGLEDRDPPCLGGNPTDSPCPFCHLGPCIIVRHPSWLVGSSSPSLMCMEKRYKLYRKFWQVLRQLGVWSYPQYLAYKATQTAVSDVRDVMPECVIKVRYLISFTCTRMFVEDSPTPMGYRIRILNHHHT